MGAAGQGIGSVLSCVLLAGLGSGNISGTIGMPSSQLRVEEVQDLQYTTNMEALRQGFRNSGQLQLTVPILGQIVVEGIEHELTSHGNRTQGLPHIALTGTAIGFRNSRANLLLGEYGVYGTVTIPIPGQANVLQFEFNAEKVDANGAAYFTRAHLTQDDVSSKFGLRRSIQARNFDPISAPAPFTGIQTPPTDIGGEGFEYGATDWAFDGMWHIATRQSATSAYNAWYGDTANLTYATGSSRNSGNLTSPSFTIPTLAPQLSFQSWYDTEDTDLTWDQKLVQISTNGGSVWNTIFRVYGAPVKTWALKTVDLSDYAGQAAILRFRFDTLDGLYNNHEGWHLDEIQVSENVVSPEAPDKCQKPEPGTAAKSVGNSPSTQPPSSAQEAAKPPNPCSEQPDCSGGSGISWVTYHAEQRLVEAESNWRDRIVSAAAQYAYMWSGLCIALRIWPVELGENVLTTDSCDGSSGNVRAEYSVWIRNTWSHDPTAWNDDAYQLWTSLNLESDDGWPPEAYCFGLAWPDEVNLARIGFTEFAASVVEGADYCCADNYDPDETDERGIVSGHELAHTYGEENHPYKCNNDDWYQTSYNCNIMRNCKDPERRSFFFTRGSKQEIMFRYHYRNETTSGIEEQAACP